jgi:hypothetical protein
MCFPLPLADLLTCFCFLSFLGVPAVVLNTEFGHYSASVWNGTPISLHTNALSALSGLFCSVAAVQATSCGVCVYSCMALR